MHKIFLNFLVSLMAYSVLAMMEESNPKLGVLKSLPEYLPKEAAAEDVTYMITPPTSGLSYKINVYDIWVGVEGHYHEHQTQDILVLEGKLKVHLDNKEPIVLDPSGKVQILPKVWHALEPVGGPVRYLSTYFFDVAQHPTGLPFPEDVNFVEPKTLLEKCTTTKHV